MTAALLLSFALVSCTDGATQNPPNAQRSPSDAEQRSQPTSPDPRPPEATSPPPSQTPSPTPVETSPAPEEELLTVGDEGPRVRKLHKRLRRLGYSDVPEANRYTNRTKQAVLSFQQDVGLPADGGFGEEERQALQDALDEQEAQRQEQEQDDSERPAGLLEEGDSGAEVTDLQKRLESLNYWVGPKDGVFGTLTEQAVLAFQGVEGLTRDGVVGPKTRRALESASVPESRAGSGDLIEIDEVAQAIYVVRDGAVRWTFHTSTGTEEPYQHPDGNTYLADTPNGRWTFAWQVDGWRDGRLGRMWRPKYFHKDGIAIHGYPSVPAWPASHGCARVTIEAMNFIWNNGLAPMGSTVLVYGRG